MTYRYGPKNDKELYEAINDLFKPHPFISRKTWEEDYRGRHIHVTYATGIQKIKDKTLYVPILVDRIWGMFLKQKNSGVTDIWWRHVPTIISEDNDMSNWGSGMIRTVDGFRFTEEQLEDELDLHFPNKQFIKQLIQGMTNITKPSNKYKLILRCSLYPFDKVLRSKYIKAEGDAVQYE